MKKVLPVLIATLFAGSFAFAQGQPAQPAAEPASPGLTKAEEEVCSTQACVRTKKKGAVARAHKEAEISPGDPDQPRTQAGVRAKKKGAVARAHKEAEISPGDPDQPRTQAGVRTKKKGAVAHAHKEAGEAAQTTREGRMTEAREHAAQQGYSK